MLSLKIVKGAELAEGVVAEMRVAQAQPHFVIGRDPSTHWPIPDRTLAISARHCEIAATGAGMVLRDLSTNGTFVNGGKSRLSGDHLLHDGDRIELGPYTIVVQSGAPRAAAVPARAPDAAAQRVAPQPPSVEATAPLRGGDPAAMLSGAPPARVGLTEILRSAPPTEASELELTKIRLAPKAAVSAESQPTPPASPRPMAPPLRASPIGPGHPAVASVTPAAAGEFVATDVLAALANGLGLPADALSGRDPAATVAQVATLARAAVAALRQLLEQQAQARRQIGSRATALVPVREVNPLRLAPSDEAALRDLLRPGADVQAPLQRAAAELASHQDRLLAAFRDAASRLGQEISPESLQAALASAGEAQLWQLYRQVWQGIGLAPDQPWSQGFQEAALLHLAAAYDEQGKR